MDKQSNEFKEQDHPSPSAFDEFLPWACKQLQVEATIVVTKGVQRDYISTAPSSNTDRSKSRKQKVVRTPNGSDLIDKISKAEMSTSRSQMRLYTESIVKVLTTYDNNEKLVRIKFNKNMVISPKIIKIISLIIQFHPLLNTVIINCGLDANVMYELCKLLSLSHITSICLDNTFYNEATYDTLLEKQSTLKQLSLARCKINDDVVKKIASRLIYPLPASQTLIILNLSSNRITDSGAKYIGEALRTNRCLNYLNLSDNQISDDGADSILKSLLEFSITHEEQHGARAKYVEFLKAKKDLMTRLLKEAMATDFDKKSNKRKAVKPPVTVTRKQKGEEMSKSYVNGNDMWLEKAEVMAENVMGEFKHAYSNNNTVVRDGIVYCSGNNTLCYLNLAYNSLSYYSVKKLLQVLKTQKINGKKPKGLINVCIEGNCLPTSCMELLEIDELLEVGLMGPTIKKKPPTRIGKTVDSKGSIA